MSSSEVPLKPTGESNQKDQKDTNILCNWISQPSTTGLSSVVQWPQFFFQPFFGGRPTKMVQAQKRIGPPFVSRVTEQLSPGPARLGLRGSRRGGAAGAAAVVGRGAAGLAAEAPAAGAPPGASASKDTATHWIEAQPSRLGKLPLLSQMLISTMSSYNLIL